jgi:hypothetical protein
MVSSKLWLFSLLGALSILGLASAQCRVRMEVRDMSPQQLQEYVDAVRELARQRNSAGLSPLDVWSRQHDINFGNIHVERFFFPW